MNKSNLNEIWRACRKIQNAVYRCGYNIEKVFEFYDPDGCGIISESKFINILAQFKDRIGLSEFEIQEITDYFRLPDRKVLYKQFCNVIKENLEHTKNPDLINGLEWNDPFHVNALSNSETRQICILLTKIAHTVRLRELVLLPYFQDYELISKDPGVVTISHFSRVLHFMKIVLSDKDFILLLKRYLKDSYTVNYVAFINDIEEIVRYFDSKRLTNYSQDIIENFPGKIININLPKLPRPEIPVKSVYDVSPSNLKNLKNILQRLKKHIQENHIPIHDILVSFDRLGQHCITKNQFLRALKSIETSRLFLTGFELETLCQNYTVQFDENCIDWRKFEDDINLIDTICLQKKPYQIVKADTPISEIEENILKHTKANDNEKNQQTLCEETLLKIKTKIKNRGLYFYPFFKDFDKCNLGHVSKHQARQVLATNSVFISDEEFYALTERYIDEMGFNYPKFLLEVEPKEEILQRRTIDCQLLETTQRDNQKGSSPKPDIIHVLAKIKRQVVIKRIQIMDFLKDYDKLNHESIPKYNFERGLNNAGIILTEEELHVINDTFQTHFCKENIDYKRFCKVINEVFYQENLERAPLLVPIQHFPSINCESCFLNFEERIIVSKALQKLSMKPVEMLNINSIFQDYDRVNCGSVSINQFLRALTLTQLKDLITTQEFDVICKCFGIERGCHLEVNYREFLRTLNILHETKQIHPF